MKRGLPSFPTVAVDSRIGISRSTSLPMNEYFSYPLLENYSLYNKFLLFPLIFLQLKFYLGQLRTTSITAH